MVLCSWDHPVVASFEWERVVWDVDRNAFDKRLKKLTDLLSLKPLLNTFARELSLGQRMRADLALMLLHSPEVIFLDEPTLGLDVLAKRQIIDYLKLLNKEENTTIIVTSHDMDDLEEMAERIILLSHGNIEFDGDFDQLRNLSKNLCQIKIFTSNGTTPKIANAKLLDARKGYVQYEFDNKDTTIANVLEELSSYKDIVDIEINKAPIEKLIAQLYVNWS
jgi:ABC-2 type transport system ATP-binding protein